MLPTKVFSAGLPLLLSILFYGIASSAQDLGPPKSGATYVGFAVDSTGSMAKEIEAVKIWIEECVSGNVDLGCGDMPTGGWIITSFNDSDVGAVIGPVRDQDRIIRIAQIYTARGGGDCPEMSLTGVMNAVKRIPLNNGNCKVFLFTDAVAKDYDKKESLEEEFLKRGCKCIPVLTGCCGKCPEDEAAVDSRREDTLRARAKRSLDDYDKTLFFTLSKKTGGNTYVMDKPSTPEAMVEFLTEEVTLGFCGTNNIAGPNSTEYKCEEDCIAMKMCWDKSVSKCYCAGNIPCARLPIHASKSQCPEWTAWLPWSACSQTCGDGKMRRERKCSVEGGCRYMRPGSTEDKFCKLKSCPDFCDPNPCGNGGTCLINFNSRGYACDCLKGWEGDNCEVPRPCVPNPCQNDGKCTPFGYRNYRCSCGHGYSGKNCQIDSCDPNPCSKRGTCKRSSNIRGYSCDCLKGWKGDQCEKNSCDPNPCGNGGTCLINSNLRGYSCDCLKEWEGDNCEESIPCVPNPCQNGEKCATLQNGRYECSCGLIHWGGNCEIDSCVVHYDL